MVAYSMNENFIRSVEQFQDRIAIENRAGGRFKTLTYTELDKEVKAAACFISSIGIRKSDRVIIILENSPEWIIIFFALAYIGAVVVPLDPRMSEKGIKNIISDSGATLAFISKEDQRLSESLKEEIRILTFEDIKESPLQGKIESARVEPDETMVLLYTSGTTDLPKGVMLTHKNLCANFYSMKQMKIFSTRDVILSVLPLYHSYSLMTTFTAPFFSGSRIIYVPPDWPEKLSDYMKEVGATMFIGVPQIYHMMHARMMKKLDKVGGARGLYIKLAISLGLAKPLIPGLRGAFGKKLRFFISGGAKLDATVARDFFKLGFKILEGYGLTETSPVASLNPIRRPKIGSIGQAIPDVELKLLSKVVNGVG